MFFALFKKLRRKWIAGRPFPEHWRRITEKNVPYYRCLNPGEQQKLLGHVMVFLGEKKFEGCGGLQITDEIRVTIAAQACILTLNQPFECYPGLCSIVVYPDTYVAKTQDFHPGGVVSEMDEPREGEAWKFGTVVLSWNDVLHCTAGQGRGCNVVFHEFAHLLDQQNGRFDGIPSLDRRSRYISWARILGREYRALSNETSKKHSTVIDQYGATNPAEFFAVVTECFFEMPRQLKRLHPRLYEELKAYYRQDPAERLDA